MDINELVRSIDIVEYISQFVDLEQRGDEWWGLSCFKDEKTPSFSVRKDPPFFYDYSSGNGGNVFSFIKLYFGCSSSEAVEKMKKYIGYDGEIGEKDGRFDGIDIIKQYMPSKSTKKESIAKPLPQNIMDRYEKRPDKLMIWENEGISRATLDKFQVCYDSYSDRLVYPIRSIDGEIVNIGGRTLDPLWKEHEQRKYCYFYSWGSINTIYGLWENHVEIKKTNEIILFEGCKSVLLADTWGIKNTGAILTSHLSENSVRILAKLGCNVVFALDKEVRVWDDKNVQRLKSFVNVSYIRDMNGVLGDKDAPVDRGRDQFVKLYDSRLRLK